MASSRLFAVGLLLGLALWSCNDKNPAKPDPDTPFPYAQPTTVTMTMNLSDLAQGKTRGPEGLCHAVSALAVTWVNVNVVVRLAVPMAALDACGQVASVYLGDDTWRWTASGGTGTGAWTAELTGRVTGQNEIAWSMLVSGTPQQLNRFLWFNGTSDTQAHIGTWRFYDTGSPQAPRELVRCDWSLPILPGAAREIAFEDTTPGGQGFGDRLVYTLLVTQGNVSFMDASAQSTVRVRWNMITGEGMGISARADTCCWGARPDFPDVPCR
jgi:hypothetical protein